MNKNTKAVLIALVSTSMTKEEIAVAQSMTKPQVNGCMASMKARGLVTQDGDKFTITADGIELTKELQAEPATKERAARTDSKSFKAKEIFAKMAGAARKDVIKAFMEEAGLTKAGAQTYYFQCAKAAKAATTDSN